LRILALGQADYSTVEADVFLLTKREPNLAPTPLGSLASNGFVLKRSEPASASLLSDLRTDRVEKAGSMDWVDPSSMWLSYLKLDLNAKDLTYDLATDVHGGEASIEDAGLAPPWFNGDPGGTWTWGAGSALRKALML
jgi:hypothetical protein